MNSGEPEQSSPIQLPLAQISTAWSVVLKAKDGAGVPSEVVSVFFARYQGAVLRFFRTAITKTDIADDMAQDFALRFMRGDFRNVHPDRGRFRDFLRIALANQLRDYYRRQQLRGRTNEMLDEIADNAGDKVPNQNFDENWREELLAQTWTDLEHHQQSTGQLYFVALKLKATSAADSGPCLVDEFSRMTDTQLSEEAFRKHLQRARRRFGELLLSNVAATLAIPTREEVERELADLKLLSFCGGLLQNPPQT